MNAVAKSLLLVLLVGPVVLHSEETEIFLQSPGLRPTTDPSIAIPAGYPYANRRLTLPHYRDSQGSPADGWSYKYVPTRRFNSDQSAWIYFRNQDLQRSLSIARGWDDRAFCIWPGGTTIVIESYQGDAIAGHDNTLIEIAMISKADKNKASIGKAFLPGEWSYGRFTPAGELSNDAAKIRECHQCHAIAFRLTGDLIFTRLP